MAEENKYTMGFTDVTVHNAEDTTSDPKEYGCDSWREYWEKQGHDRNDKSLVPLKTKLAGDADSEAEMTYRCPMCKRRFHWDGELPDCFDGCHVVIEGDKKQKIYITPMCHSCNHKEGSAKVPRRMLEVAPPIENED